jgi:hypothetical protein
MKTVALVVKTEKGFIDPFSGNLLKCIAEGNGVDALVEKYRELRASGSIASKKAGEEIKLVDMLMIGTGVTDGVYKARKRF